MTGRFENYGEENGGKLRERGCGIILSKIK